MRRVLTVLLLACMFVGEALPAMAGSSRGDLLTSQIMTARRFRAGKWLKPTTPATEVAKAEESTKEETSAAGAQASVSEGSGELVIPDDNKSKESATPSSGEGSVILVSAGESHPLTTGMSAADVAANATQSPPSGTKWDHFYEVSGYAGYYHGFDAGTNGFWFLGEGIRWSTQRTDAQNFGVGVTVKGGYGYGRADGVHWGSIAFGPNFDYWREVGLDQYLLLKLRPMWRFNESPGGNGFMPGAYLEYDRVLGRNDMFIAALDGQYFRNDSYVGLSLMIEHRFNRNIKAKAGIGFTLQDLQSGTILGIGPTASIKFYDRLVLGASLNFIQGGPVLGVYAGYELNTDLRAFDAKLREKSVSITAPGVTASMPDGGGSTQLTTAGEDYLSLPTAEQFTISNETL